MKADRRSVDDPRVLEAVAAVEHERWSHWQRYMHSQCLRNDDGSLTVPPALVRRWERQMSTPYESLTDGEKESDREQAREYLAVVKRELGDATSS